jgi:ribonuclease HI
MAKKNVYVVVKGRVPGIYQEWYGENGAEKQVSGFQGAVYKGFPTRAEAERWQKEQALSPAKPVPALQPTTTTAPPRQPSLPTPPETAPTSDKIVVYTDGGCNGNPGPGGYGAVILRDGQRQELSGGYRLTTNNRMELMACIVALQSLSPGSHVVLHSDSQYVVNSINKGWAKRWRANYWWRNKEERAENPDLWAQLLDLCEQHDVEFVWVRGHVGTVENERCDRLSVAASGRSNLPPDPGYGRLPPTLGPLFDYPEGA